MTSPSIPLGSCSHLQALKAAQTDPPLGALYARLVRTLVAPGSSGARATKCHALLCHVCGADATQKTLHICLHCVYFACHAGCFSKHRAKERRGTKGPIMSN